MFNVGYHRVEFVSEFYELGMVLVFRTCAIVERVGFFYS